MKKEVTTSRPTKFLQSDNHKGLHSSQVNASHQLQGKYRSREYHFGKMISDERFSDSRPYNGEMRDQLTTLVMLDASGNQGDLKKNNDGDQSRRRLMDEHRSWTKKAA